MPPSVGSTGQEAVELARMAGLMLDPWQELVLERSLGERADGKWAAFEVGLVVPRQNGKDAVLEARELAGLFLLGERLLIHSAHQFDTSLEHFRRLLFLIENTPDFDRRVARVRNSHGEEGIELRGGQRIRFRTRTKGGGRGFSCDFLALNEAMELAESTIAALFPTLSARPNPQVWYTGSAVDRNVHDNGSVLARVRRRGIQGDDPRLAYFEWAADADLDSVHEVVDDPQTWADGNPGFGLRISEEQVAQERRAMDLRTFAVERLGVGDWPPTGEDEGDGITQEMWKRCEDPSSRVVDPVRFGFDVRPDRQKAAIAVAGFRDDGLRHVEVVEYKSGTGWVAARLGELLEHYETGPVVFDERSPAAALVPKLVEAGLPFEAFNGSEYAQACGAFFDDVEQAELRHLGGPELTAAVRGAARRPLGDAWAWSRKNSTVDICPLVACTLARWAVRDDRDFLLTFDDEELDREQV